MKEKISNLKDKTKKYIKNNEKKIKDFIYLALYVSLIFIILFSVAKVIKTKTNFYKNDLKFRWDNILSYDDIFYARDIYTQEQKYENTISTIVKHPFIRAFGHIFAFIENNIFENMNKTDHYFHIVVFQLFVNIVGIIYLYKILKEQYGLRNRYVFLLLTIYEIATVSLLGTLIVETFLLSGTLLIMSYYYLNKQKVLPSIILGVLLTGITITNCISFALMTIFLIKDKKNILKIGISCIIILMLLLMILPYRNFLIKNFDAMVNDNVERFAKEQTGITYVKMIFYNLLTSPVFFIKQVHVVPKGLDFVTFELASSKVIMLTTIMYFGVIIYNIIRNIKDRKLLAALAVFVYNMILHAVVKFGLYEGTIYGMHFLFAEILMFAFGFKIENKKIRNVFIAFSVLMLLVQLRYNIKGMLDILLLLPNWK